MLSRNEFVDAIKQAGFPGRPGLVKDSAEVPAEIEKLLEKMDFVCQFSAVRQLHELIRADGESPQRPTILRWPWPSPPAPWPPTSRRKQ